MSEPVEWRNKRGLSRWQPRASDDSRMWINYWDDDNSGVWRMEGDTPYLCSYRRAVKLGRQEEQRMERVEMDENYQEVTR